MNPSNSIIQVTDNQLCFGCGACQTSCAKEAISLSFSSTGRLLPHIDETLCNNCGVCLNVCPGIDIKKEIVNGSTDPFKGNIKGIYVGKSNNPTIYNNAQSGGITTEILTCLFEKGLIDAALVARMDFGDDLKGKAVIITNPEDLIACQKSIYTPINLLGNLKETFKYKRIVIVGLPCHLQGIIKLKNLFPKKYAHILYLIGLICDRTLSQGVVDVILENEKTITPPYKIHYRDKHSPNYKRANMLISSENGERKTIQSSLRHSLKQYFTPPRCKICFDKMNTQADIVLGDPWGMKNIDWENGESLVITRTQEGNKLIESLIADERISLVHAKWEDVYVGQGIEQRKKSIFTNLKKYESLNLKPPFYIDLLKPYLLEETDTKSVQSNEIDRYLYFESISRKKIIRHVLVKLRQSSYKNLFYHFISLFKQRVSTLITFHENTN